MLWSPDWWWEVAGGGGSSSLVCSRHRTAGWAPGCSHWSLQDSAPADLLLFLASSGGQHITPSQSACGRWGWQYRGLARWRGGTALYFLLQSNHTITPSHHHTITPSHQYCYQPVIRRIVWVWDHFIIFPDTARQVPSVRLITKTGPVLSSICITRLPLNPHR